MLRSETQFKESDVKLNEKPLVRRARPIDLVHLAKQTSGDSQLEAEVLGMFANMSSTYLDRLRDVACKDNFAINIHALRGAAMGVGANSIVEHARAIETEFKASGDVCDEAMTDLAVVVEEAGVFIASLLKK